MNDFSRGFRTSILPGLVLAKHGVGTRNLDSNTALVVTENSTQYDRMNGTNTSLKFYYARECGCFSTIVYCPMFSMSCVPVNPIDTSGFPTPGCVSEAKKLAVGNFFFNLVIIWFVLLALFTVSRDFGRAAVDYVISTCNPNWNTYVVGRILQRNPDRARRYVRTYIYRRRRMLERRVDRNIRTPADDDVDVLTRPQDTRKLTSLVLRTKRYRSTMRTEDGGPSIDDNSSHDDGESGTGMNCSICFAPFLDGDRVGALPCDHVFHVDCLKSWLPRRNVCPLCLTQNIASLRFDETMPGAPKETSRSQMQSLQPNQMDSLQPNEAESPSAPSQQEESAS